jgi:hypothetical protein
MILEIFIKLYGCINSHYLPTMTRNTPVEGTIAAQIGAILLPNRPFHVRSKHISLSIEQILSQVFRSRLKVAITARKTISSQPTRRDF